MRFANIVPALAAGLLLRPPQGAMASEASIPASAVEVEDLTEDMPIHDFPTLWTFETKGEYPKTPLLLEQIQEAFILAANEVHDTTQFRFDSAFIKSVMDEIMDDSDTMMLGDDADAEEVGALRGIAKGILGQGDAEGALGRKGRLDIRRVRTRVRVRSEVECYLCGEDDAFISSPFPSKDFYFTEEGQDTMKRWEKNFCGKLKRIKGIPHPERCFIFLDVDHDDHANNPSLLLTPPEAMASEASIPASAVEVEDLTEDMPIHDFPTLWTFETKGEYPKTPLLLEQIQEAFILAANEVHDTTQFRFDSAFIKSVMDEIMDDSDTMMLGDDTDAEEVGALRGIAKGILGQGDAEGALGRKGRLDIRRVRTRVRVRSEVECYLCGEDDAFISSPFPSKDFYFTEEGQDTMKRWEKNFCGKLKRIKGIPHPERCFIFLDVDHDDHANNSLLEE